MFKQATISLLLMIVMIVTGISAQTDEQPTAPPLTLDGLEVLAITETELLAGPRNNTFYLAPNGEKFAYIASNELCFYTIAVEVERCIDLREAGLPRVDLVRVAWSHDSRYLALHGDLFIAFHQPDINVIDSTTGEITVLDPDPPIEFGSDDWGRLDVSPQWLPDGRLAFLRLTRLENEDRETFPPHIMVYDPEDETIESLGVIEVGLGQSLGIFEMFISGDGQTIVHNMNMHLNDSPTNGIWHISIEDWKARQSAFYPAPFVPSIVGVSPDGKYALLMLNNPSLTTMQSAMYAVDLATGEEITIDEDRVVVTGGWSPDGSLFAYLVNDVLHEKNGLYVTDSIGTPGERILEGDFRPLVFYIYHAIQWGANNTLVLNNVDHQAILIQLGN